jgi:transposase-like protein
MRRHYTAEQRDQFLDLVASGHSVRKAAARLGIATSTASYWVRRAAGKAKQLRQREARRGGEPPAFARLSETKFFETRIP